MVKRNIKFPLKMKNGAEVRNLEDLRENADVESIMQYYISGQLSRWCRAFDIDKLPEKITENNEIFVNRILKMIGIELPVEDIHNYVNNNFGNSAKLEVIPDADEEKIKFNKEIKDSLKEMINDDINLDDYKIEVKSIEDGIGNIYKYRVCITNDRTEYYSRFSISNELDNDYTREMLEKELYKKIKYAVENAEKSVEFFNNKLINVGDTFDFGTYNGKPIKWKILSKSNDLIYIISVAELCRKKYHNNDDYGSNNWEKSDIRKWLNGEFYNNTFTENEKKIIETVESDKVTLLSRDEVDELMERQDLFIGSWWWLRSEFPIYSHAVWAVGNTVDGTPVNGIGGVRPTLTLRF